ncbi:MAG: oligoendopeptidase F [Caldilineaceae bacterium]|nr:oligoendopeptidase F [Caldilineaceae bacterium]
MQANTVLLRKDAPVESQWDVDHVFPSWQAWEAEFEAVKGALPQVASFEGRLGEGPEVLADWLEMMSQVWRRVMRLRLYPYMHTVVNTNDTQAKGNLGQTMGLVAQLQAASAYGDPEMLALGNQLLVWAKENDRLAIYAHHFDNLLRQQKHVRSPEIEAILGRLQESFSAPFQTYSELTNADLDLGEAEDSSGKRYPTTQSNIGMHVQSPDRTRRRTAWERYSDAYVRMKNTLASNYIAHVKQAVFMARERGYNSVLESMLVPHNIPLEVFHNLLATFQRHLPTWHRYWEVKRRALGVETIHPYDIWAPLVQDPPKVEYKQAVDWLVTSLAPLGEEYTSTLRRACLEERWVDWAPNAEKRQGAQSLPASNTHPFLWLSYDDSLSGASTLAHEAGHSLHSYLSDRNQPEVYAYYNMSAAETASNFNQAMLRAYLANEKAGDERFQLASIDEAMDNFHRYFFIMPTLARFELAVYTRAEEGKPLTVDFFNNTMADLFAEGYGETMTDDRTRTASTWSQFLHLYMPYYTFQYAVGISAAHDISARILAGDAEAAQRYLGFLSAGSSRYPVPLFAGAGVDLTSAEPVERTFAVLDAIVDRLATLAG